MTAPRRLAIGLAVIVVAIGVVAYNGIRSAAVYYLTPSEFAARPDLAQARVRLAGTVVPGSLQRSDDRACPAPKPGREPDKARGCRVTGFRLGDGASTLAVRYDGPLPDLFAEGREVLVEGRLAADGVFDATVVITTHPTEYKEGPRR